MVTCPGFTTAMGALPCALAGGLPIQGGTPEMVTGCSGFSGFATAGTHGAGVSTPLAAAYTEGALPISHASEHH